LWLYFAFLVSSSFGVWKKKKEALKSQIEVLQVLFENFTLKKQKQKHNFKGSEIRFLGGLD
jgi:hypothetical protein